MSLATSNRDGGRTNEAGHLRSVSKAILGQVLTGLNVSQRGAGANMSVDVAIGDAVVQRSDGTYGHPAWNDAVYNQVIAAADGSNPRRDIIVMYIDYGQTPSTGVANNTNGVVKIKSVSGTAAGSPVDPSNAAIQSSVGSGNPWIKLARVRLAAGATSVSNSVIDDLREMATSLDNNGWISVPNSEISSWSYASWSAATRTGIINVPTNATTKYNVGNRLRLVQSTGGTKYGIITAVSATTLTVFFPLGTTFNNEAILNPYFSRVDTPLGFDPDPALWELVTIDNQVRSRTSPTASVWYDSTVNLVVPVGSWEMRFQLSFAVLGASAGALRGKVTLAAASATEDDPDMTCYVGATSVSVQIGDFTRAKTKKVASQTTYRLNFQTANSAANDIQLLGSANSTQIRALCAYL